MKRNNVAKLEIVKEEEVMENQEVEVVETTPVKKKWSTKKKLAVAGAAVLGLVLGAVALTHKNKNVEEETGEDEDVGIEVIDEEETEETEESTDATQTTEI